MPPALLFRRGRYGIGAAKSVSGHTVEPPEAGDARRSGNPKGRLKKPTGCVAALVPRTRSSHNVAASLLRTSGSKGALEASIFLVDTSPDAPHRTARGFCPVGFFTRRRQHRV